MTAKGKIYIITAAFAGLIESTQGLGEGRWIFPVILLATLLIMERIKGDGKRGSPMSPPMRATSTSFSEPVFSSGDDDDDDDGPPVHRAAQTHVRPAQSPPMRNRVGGGGRRLQ